MPAQCSIDARTLLSRISTSLLLACVSLSVDAQDATPESAPQQTIGDIEQIIVVGERTPYLLRARIKETEKRLFSAYNEVNENEDYDVECDEYTPTMSHISEQRCWPVFFHNIVADEAQRAMLLQDFNITSPDKLAVLYASEFDRLRANIVAVANDHPEVAATLMEYGGLKQALEETMEICRQGKKVLFILYKCTESDGD